MEPAEPHKLNDFVRELNFFKEGLQGLAPFKEKIARIKRDQERIVTRTSQGQIYRIL